ncbi:competence/damage-inducible protein A [Metabacillus fastidiosus]|uniref:competence/damage-inducible protein A n=1 Tax=Metabacillus fastidiosus TaxID=1458 RepID=UPI002E20A142|nr:competence/damage-inducible protein A [Metabacillus fastidiosus]
MEAKTEIIAVGSELLLGQIVNSNAQFLSKQLAEIGINVYYHTVVGDNAERLKQAIKTAQERANIIIFTGGLGPTKDDLTKETIADVLGKKLVTNEEALANIQDFFNKTKRVMSENNKKQAIVLEDAEVLRNETGMAPGMGVEVDGRFYILLPGPPSEMKPMFTNYGQQFLIDKLGIQDKIISRVLRYFGIGESKLETDIEDIIDAQTNPTIAPLASNDEVTLRLTAKHTDEAEAMKLLDEMEEKINARVGEYCYGYEQTTIVGELKKLLHEKNLTIAAAESLTGGLFSEQLTATEGASSIFKGSIVCYTNEVKEQLLKVSSETLENEGAVSAACATEMADNIRKLTGSDIGISFTGVAGPDSLERHPVGTVFIGISIKDRETEVHEINWAGSRNAVRTRTVKFGCHYIMQILKQ